jgi:hypothetical protein
MSAGRVTARPSTESLFVVSEIVTVGNDFPT